jgi:hypothetical protein
VNRTTNDLKAFVTDDWQRDALRVVMVDHYGHLVSKVVTDPAGATPILKLVGYDPPSMTKDDEQGAGILLPLVVARELYEALGRHFGDHQDPASRELVDVLKAQVGREGERVDAMIGHLTRRTDV